MDDQTLDRLLSGDLSSLPSQPKRVVRLFISSTFTDMTLERNSLMEHVYPRLKKFCRERHGLDFQVVDMRWGVRDEATDDHQTASLCSREIDNCQRMSLGPNFVALLGDKYGFRPLCNRIRSTEYRAIRRSLIELDINTDFLDTWYKEDLNALPAEHVLQPISSILRNFTNKAEPELQSVDQAIWGAIQERLHELLLVGSGRLVEQNRLSAAERLMRYSISVTEREVIEGLLDVKEAGAQCLAYVRSISDLRDQVGRCLNELAMSSGQPANEQSATSLQADTIKHQEDNPQSANDNSTSVRGQRKDSQLRRASLKIGEDTISLATGTGQNAAQRRADRNRRQLAKYIDMVSVSGLWQVDEDAQTALSRLKGEKLEQKLTSRNLTRFQVTWGERDGLSSKQDEHKQYLKELTEHFYANTTRLIKRAARKEIRPSGPLVAEALQHAHYALQASARFHGRAEELNVIEQYLFETEAQPAFNGELTLATSIPNSCPISPVFVYGHAGAGKTSFLARVASQARSWLQQRQAQAHQEERWDRKPCIIMRFCGTTPSSSSMVGVLSSICQQLQFNFYQFGPLNGITMNDELTSSKTWNQQQQQQQQHHQRRRQLPLQPIPSDLVRLVFLFRQLLDNCNHEYHRHRMFLILLDSVERLSAASDSGAELRYAWLTSLTRLPSNVRFVVSCSSEGADSDLRHLKRHFLMLENDRRSLNVSATPRMVHIKPLGTDLALELARSWLLDCGRQLSQQQWSLVGQSFEACSRPIFVKLAFGEVVNWKSYSSQAGAQGGLSFCASLVEGQLEQLAANSRQQKTATFEYSDDPFDCALLQLVQNLELEQQQQQLTNQAQLVERQWLNYLEHEQRRGQIVAETSSKQSATGAEGRAAAAAAAAGVGTDQTAEHNLVITIGGAGTSSGSSLICALPTSIEDAISQLFSRIEIQHGLILTRHSFAYITAARNGLCEHELEDLLSLDDVVLDDVFQYHLPPVRRIPPLLWTRIRNDLPGYLSERDADGIVVDWHHSQFRAVCETRYLADRQLQLYVHSMLADYFLAIWADRPKPFKCTRQQVQLAAEQLDSAVQKSLRDSQSRPSLTSVSSLGHGGRLAGGSAQLRSGASFSARSRLRSSDQHDQRLQWMQAKADRRVPQQPLFYEDSGSESKDEQTSSSNHNPQQATSKNPRRRYNLRKLTELPHHLIRAGRFSDLLGQLLFDYHWLRASLEALGLQSLLVDLSEASVAIERTLDYRTRNQEKEEQPFKTPPVPDPELLLADPVRHSVAKSEFLSDENLRSMLQQLSILESTLKLSSSSINADARTLGPQLVGRLLAVTASQEDKQQQQQNINYLGQLVDQCDREAGHDCALLATDQCLQAPRGLQLSSLEGHPFGVTSMAWAPADPRHLMAVSSRFIGWDLATGEISRDVDPRLSGALMRQLRLAASNELALAYATDNQIILLDVLTQQTSCYSGFASLPSGSIRGLELVDESRARQFVVWTSSRLFLFNVNQGAILPISSRLSSPPTTVGTLATSRVPQTDPQSVMSQEASLELTASWALGELGGPAESSITSVQMRTTSTSGRAARQAPLALIELSHLNNELSLISLRLIGLPGKEVQRWPQFPGAANKMVAFGLGVSQLVSADSRGQIHLRRLRQCSWSQAKLLGQVSELTRVLAIELESSSPIGESQSWDTFGSYECSTRSKQEDQLLLLERQIDQLDDQLAAEIQPNLVFQKVQQLASGLDKKDPLSSGGGSSSSSRQTMVKIYLADRIVVGALGKSVDSWSRLMLADDVRNMSIEANRSQLRSVCVENLLVASWGRRLLFYELASGSLIRSIDGHQARIVQLLPVRYLAGSGSQAKISLVASGSLDGTVRIWNLANLVEEAHPLDKLEQPLEELWLASARPLAVGLARRELGLWDWRTMRLLARTSDFEAAWARFEQSAHSDRPRRLRAARCKFSANSSHLGVASNAGSLLLFALEPLDQGRPLQLVGELRLPRAAIVRRLWFCLQDSRLVCAFESCSLDGDQTEMDSDELQTDSRTSSQSMEPAGALDKPISRMSVLLCSVPDCRKLYKFTYVLPKATDSKQGAQETNRAGSRWMPVITRDQLSIVCVAAASSAPGANSSSTPVECRNSNLVLNVYSTRDGLLVRIIPLDQLAAVSRATLKARVSIPSEGSTEATPAKQVDQRQSRGPVGELFRLKAISYRERQSVVALLDECGTGSALVDVQSAQLLASSSLWSGRVSGDARIGLAWPQVAGLDLLDMRRLKPLRCLLAGPELQAELDKSSASGQARRSGLAAQQPHNKRIGSSALTEPRALVCGFTRPNDAYVYVHEPASRLLLLLRLHDGRLVANYRLSAAARRIRLAADGFALILALADGSLCSLAIADPQKAETLARLAQYPSRRR